MEHNNLPPVDELLALDNQICFRLYAVSRAIQRQYRSALNTLGITYPQYLVLLAMWQWQSEQPHFRPSLRDITERLHLDSGTVTPLIARMVSAGWLNKTVCADDGRAWSITLTKKASKLKQQAVIVPESVLCSMPASLDFAQLKSVLDTLLSALSNKAGAP
ncbi:MAG: MarR family transcriptional regulator [Cellvibrionaceae bacterium]|nr:MarR family transcriptional regulator [Cellvibrionaceae bacterium]